MIVTPWPFVALDMPVITGYCRPLIVPLKTRMSQVLDWTLNGSEMVQVTSTPSAAVIVEGSSGMLLPDHGLQAT